MNEDTQNNNNEELEEDVDDVVIDEDAELTTPDVVKKLREKLKTAIEEKQNYLNSWQRDKADFINAKKRDEEDKKNFVKYAEENLIAELIPALDSFDMAMNNKEAWEKADKNWRIGVEYINTQILSVLQSHGLQKINPIGKPFDPQEHHSMGNVPTEKKEEDHVVLEVVGAGYSLNGKVIRPAKVKVGEFKGDNK